MFQKGETDIGKMQDFMKTKTEFPKSQFSEVKKLGKFGKKEQPNGEDKGENNNKKIN